MKYGVVCVSLLFGLSGVSFMKAAQEDFAAGGIGAPWLALSSDARATGMGGAFVGLANDVNSLAFNPAGLGQIKRMELSLMHNIWIEDIAAEHVAFAYPLFKGAAVAASVDYVNFGEIDTISVVNGTAVVGPSIKPSGLAASLGFGQRVMRGLYLGATAKMISEDLGASSSSAIGADVGALWKPGAAPFRLGLAIRNLGGEIEGHGLPAMASVGGTYLFKLNDDRMYLAADVHVPFEAADITSFNLGVEYLTYKRMLAFRAGYEVKNRNGLEGLTGLAAGIGYRHTHFELNYAYKSVGDLGSGNQVAVIVRF